MRKRKSRFTGHALSDRASACGADKQAERAAAQKRAKAAQDRREQAQSNRLKAEHEKKVAAATLLATTCQSQLGQRVDDIGELGSRLDIGLTYEDLPAEKALNEYAKATRTWGDCVDDLYCSNDSVKS
ncbi:hypothetical protein [Solirubrobacter soli]|uniref:hypothetical protein n=1 Tax=Solirubrobacter soli TaxID=363832 RepID=UPI0003FCFB0E|nr:hypothetical protein [Solirubrobacter soli]